MREGEKEEKKRVVEQIFFAPKLHEAHKFTAEDLLDLKPLRILEIDSLLDDILPGLTIKDRSYHGVSYPRCFVGENLVAYLVLHNICSSVPDAVEKCRILTKCHIFEHVTQQHDFENKYYFYRLRETHRLIACRLNDLKQDALWAEQVGTRARGRGGGVGDGDELPMI